MLCRIVIMGHRKNIIRQNLSSCIFITYKAIDDKRQVSILLVNSRATPNTSFWDGL